MKYNDEKTIEPVETDRDAIAKEIGRKIMNLPQSAQDQIAGAIAFAQLTATQKAG